MIVPPPYQIYLGWDSREWRAFNVASLSIKTHATSAVIVHRLAMSTLKAKGLYTRPTQHREEGGYWDEISQAPMSTGHAIARFFVPYLQQYAGWALFADGDILLRRDIGELFALADDRCAVQVVQHRYAPIDTVKMDGQVQTQYARKNWSSVMLLNCAHPSHRALNLELLNSVPGRDLHRFCWLLDDHIGALPEAWNWLEGHSSPSIDPALCHFTSGVPDMPGYEHVAYADEWYVVARRCGYKLTQPAKAEAVA